MPPASCSSSTPTTAPPSTASTVNSSRRDTPHLEPIDAFWGARYAVVNDPDGNHVGIMSPSDEEHRSVPGV